MQLTVQWFSWKVWLQKTNTQRQTETYRCIHKDRWDKFVFTLEDYKGE